MSKYHRPCPLYDSVLTRAWLFVTFTPNCFALAMISMRFRAETECEILCVVSRGLCVSGVGGVLGGEGLVVHEEEVDVADVVDDERLVAAGHQVAGPLVGSVTDLHRIRQPKFQQPDAGAIFSMRATRSVARIAAGSRTLGIAAWPLNRLRTRLSIPLGFLHDGSTPIHSQILLPLALDMASHI
jgi:hypothetical protein